MESLNGFNPKTLETPKQNRKNHKEFQLKPRSRMASISTSRYFAALSLLILFFKTVSSDSNSTFDFKNFAENSKFELQLALYGDAKVVNGGSFVQITGSSSSSLSAGRVFYRKPIKLVDGNPREIVSFSTYFSFSISPESGDGLAFDMVPIGFPLNAFDNGSFGLLDDQKFRTLLVEFDTLMDNKYGDLNANHVGIDIDGLVSLKVSNVSSMNLVLNSGEKLQSWIDYEAGSKQLEVRLSKLGEFRPVVPLISFPIDLSLMWKEQAVFVGLSSSNVNSSQTCNVYSWSFRLRQVPHWMHSQPLDPMAFNNKTRTLTVCKRRDCLSKILAALIFVIACGALGAFVVLFVWTLLANRRPVVPEECTAQPVGFEYEKFKVVADKAIEDGKK
ncbi:unnamed protein product [Camellia sinensis]